MRYASRTPKVKLPLVVSTSPPPRVRAKSPEGVPAMICSKAIGLSPGVPRERHLQDRRGDPVVQEAPQGSPLDQEVLLRGRPLVVDVVGAAQVGQGSGVVDRHPLGGDLLPDASGVERVPAPGVVPLEPMADGLVEEHAASGR
jgi:hypothetical protein